MSVLIAILGGLFAAGVDATLEVAKRTWNLEGKPPFIEIAKPLPTLDKVLLIGISAVPLLFSKDMGAGSLAYGIGQFAVRTISNMVAPKPSF